GIRAAVAVSGAGHHLTLPGGVDSGRSEVIVANPGTGRAPYSGTLERTDGSQPLGQIKDETPPSGQARPDEVSTSPGSTIELDVTSRRGVATARRSFGAWGDEDATTGGVPA